MVLQRLVGAGLLAVALVDDFALGVRIDDDDDDAEAEAVTEKANSQEAVLEKRAYQELAEAAEDEAAARQRLASAVTKAEALLDARNQKDEYDHGRKGEHHHRHHHSHKADQASKVQGDTEAAEKKAKADEIEVQERKKEADERKMKLIAENKRLAAQLKEQEAKDKNDEDAIKVRIKAASDSEVDGMPESLAENTLVVEEKEEAAQTKTDAAVASLAEEEKHDEEEVASLKAKIASLPASILRTISNVLLSPLRSHGSTTVQEHARKHHHNKARSELLEQQPQPQLQPQKAAAAQPKTNAEQPKSAAQQAAQKDAKQQQKEQTHVDAEDEDEENADDNEDKDIAAEAALQPKQQPQQKKQQQPQPKQEQKEKQQQQDGDDCGLSLLTKKAQDMNEPTEEGVKPDKRVRTAIMEGAAKLKAEQGDVAASEEEQTQDAVREAHQQYLAQEKIAQEQKAAEKDPVEEKQDGAEKQDSQESEKKQEGATSKVIKKASSALVEIEGQEAEEAALATKLARLVEKTRASEQAAAEEEELVQRIDRSISSKRKHRV